MVAIMTDRHLAHLEQAVEYAVERVTIAMDECDEAFKNLHDYRELLYQETKPTHWLLRILGIGSMK